MVKEMSRTEMLGRVHILESLECHTKACETIFQQQEARKLVFEKWHMKIGVFGGLVWQLCVG